MYYTNHLTSIPTILTSIKLNDKGLGAESGHACGADVRPRQPTRRRAVHGPVTVLSLLLALNLADLLRIRVRCKGEMCFLSIFVLVNVHALCCHQPHRKSVAVLFG